MHYKTSLNSMFRNIYKNIFQVQFKSEQKSREGDNFPQACRDAPWDLLWALPLGNPSEQSCQLLENPIHPSSYTQLNPSRIS